MLLAKKDEKLTSRAGKWGKPLRDDILFLLAANTWGKYQEVATETEPKKREQSKTASNSSSWKNRPVAEVDST